MTTERRTVLLALVPIAVLFVSEPALAYCRRTTTPVPADSTAACFSEGKPVYYPTTCLPYHLQNKTSTKIPHDVLSDGMASAFALWTAPNDTCSPGIQGIELAPVDDANIVNTVEGKWRNVVGVVEDVWPHPATDESVALVTVTFNAETGAILESDMEINAVDYAWSFGKAPAPGTYDLETVLEHEVGHMIGLAHSTDPNASMFPKISPGEVRTVDEDDKKGICAIYPNRTTRTAASGAIAAGACNLAPGVTTSTTPCDPIITHGCASISATPRDGGTPAPMGALGVILAAGGALGARRSRRR